MTNLPIDIINKINGYKPNDKNVKSPTSKCFNYLIAFYGANDLNVTDAFGLMYLARKDEPFYKYVLRINNGQYKLLKLANIPFSDAHLYFNVYEDD